MTTNANVKTPPSAHQPAGKAAAIPQDPMRSITALLQGQRKQIACALPKHMTPDRMLRIALTELRKSHQLQNAHPLSFLAAVIQCAQIGLEPGSALGHVYLVPYKSEVQPIIGYRGMIELARRSGQIVSIGAYPVYEQDEFSYEFGLEPTIRHRPAQVAEPGALTHVYGVARLKDGGVQFEVMTRAQVDAIMMRAMSNKSRSPWQTDFDEMARKTVIRRLFKYLPVSVEMARAVELSEREDTEESAPLEITNFETGEPISLQMPHATSDEIKAHQMLEALEREWFKVKEMGGDPEQITKRTAEQMASESQAKQQVAFELLVAWQKQQEKK